ncbi:hypothetical protein M1L60_35475 [Actinoplanes sp. TRM 88003]|uniref:Uncharacterized protein n=1 Tax=Paractinoplanes aksuensis TaxID=2939490 RepID=A0ABT1DZ96_9ACTN|nr:hypothetical protein [Actinoplanes aksuensis]MCO8275893.1 hypothetical protein [Actinoplanes aksuensis]
MVYPFGPGPEVGGPVGESYAVALVRTGDASGVTGVLRRLRFTGWVAPVQGEWVPVVAVPGGGTVAAGRRGIVGVGEELAGEFGATVLVLRVLADRQLALVAWVDGEETGRFVSDPSREPGADEDVLDDPLGLESTASFAAAAGHPERGQELVELLREPIDPENVIESERLSRVLRLLDLPTWLVAVVALPRDIPTGPQARETTRLGLGRTGLAGLVLPRLTRRRRRPPPVIADAPQGGPDMDPWLM